MVTAILGTVGGLVALVAGILAIREHVRRAARIVTPPDNVDCGGRYMAMSGVVPWRNPSCAYWIAIQPSDCRGAGVWWPQGPALTFDWRGRWQIKRATLGRDGEEGRQDIGKTYTTALVEVPSSSKDPFNSAARRGERLQMPLECGILHSVEIRRTG